MATSYSVLTLNTVPSTQDEAATRFSGEPLLVIAGRQTAGRGRSGNDWWQAPRALYASLAFRPDWPEGRAGRLSLVAGLAAREAVAGSVGLKWPNDLVTAPGKVGGLLLEAHSGIVIAGLGVNLWWPESPVGAAALHDGDPGPAAAGDMARRWAEALLRRAGAGPDAWGRDEYLQACVTLGSEITWDPDGRGTAVDVDSDGGLMVETAAGMTVLHAGEVRAVR